jgi:hypothetical protein
MTKIIINKDLDLKLMCKLIFNKMGFSTHYEVKLRTKSYISSYQTHDISDIDVYGYKFNADLSFFSVGSECKSGDSGALEELFKFLGIVDYYKLDRGYLFKSKIHQNARQVAIQNKLRCLTEAEARQMLLGFDIEIDKSLKIENAKYYKLNKNLNSFKSKNEKLINYILLDFWNRENWKNIHNLLHLLNTPSNSELFTEGILKANEKFVYYFVLELFSMALLRIISESMILNFSDIENSVINSLYGGAEPLNEKRKIHDLVSQATQQNNKFEPEWLSDLIHISFRFSQATYAASKIPVLIQDLYENSLYDAKLMIKVESINKYPDLTRKFTQDLMQFMTKHCNFDKTIFEDFMKF